MLKPRETAHDPASNARALHREVREALAALRHACGASAAAPSVAEHARTVVVIASSSRGGSSLLAEILRAAPGLAHFPAEINPALRLADLMFPCTPSGSDALEASDITPAALREVDRELSAQCGVPDAAPASDADRERYALHLACRLTMQWPGETFTLDGVRAWMREALDHPYDPVAFHATFLEAARRCHPCVDPLRYDLPTGLVGLLHNHVGPPGAALIEEPPFVAVPPWRGLTAAELKTRPLVVKTPANAYRLSAIQALFPRARLRVVHLVRNAGASINGLYDGWRHHGFFAHALEERLNIRGYSELGPWARHWWKFDLPPGWEALTTAPLLDVCAHQWSAAHQTVLGWLAANPGVDRFRLRFEDVVGPEERRRPTWEALEAWLGVPLVDPLATVIRDGLPPIMATERPQRRRWAMRSALLEPVLADAAIRETMEALGYATDPAGWD